MKRFALLTFLLFAFLGAFAQNISVKSFKALPMDMTASSLEGKRIDQNGEVAALIKVMTTETGFVFEGGTLGIIDTQQRVGEIWVWVPRASRKITILHQQLGGLRDYRYPVEIEAERTYEMVLTTAKIETVVKEEVRQQYLVFELEPKNATLEVNDQLWSVDANGTALQFVDFGTYTYRVRAANYETDAGVVTVDDPENPKTINVKLKPNFAEVTLKVDADAEIWVNNQKKGTRRWTGSLGNGTYKIECKQANHETSMVSKEITPAMNGETIKLPLPKPIYGSLNVESTPVGATIIIDGKEVGKTPKSINEILIGEHEIRLTKNGYTDYTKAITIIKSEREQMRITLENGKGQEAYNENTTKDNVILVKDPLLRKKDRVFMGSNIGLGWGKANIYDTYDSISHNIESGIALTIGFDCAFLVGDYLKVGCYCSVGGSEGDSWYYGNWDFKLDAGLLSVVDLTEQSSLILGVGMSYSDNYGIAINGRLGYKYKVLYFNSEVYYANWGGIGHAHYGNYYGVLLHLGYQFGLSKHQKK